VAGAFEVVVVAAVVVSVEDMALDVLGNRLSWCPLRLQRPMVITTI
jgi:hypothetical protein